MALDLNQIITAASNDLAMLLQYKYGTEAAYKQAQINAYTNATSVIPMLIIVAVVIVLVVRR